MPIYEYVCKSCDAEFELLVNRSTQPICPECRSGELEKKLSTFAATSSGAASSSELPACGTCGVPGGPCALN